MKLVRFNFPFEDLTIEESPIEVNINTVDQQTNGEVDDNCSQVIRCRTGNRQDNDSSQRCEYHAHCSPDVEVRDCTCRQIVDHCEEGQLGDVAERPYAEAERQFDHISDGGLWHDECHYQHGCKCEVGTDKPPQDHLPVGDSFLQFIVQQHDDNIRDEEWYRKVSGWLLPLKLPTEEVEAGQHDVPAEQAGDAIEEERTFGESVYGHDYLRIEWRKLRQKFYQRSPLNVINWINACGSVIWGKQPKDL